MKAFKSGIIGLMMLAGACGSALAGQERLGGHDGGGAGIQLSTETEVREAIQWAMEDLRKEATKEKEGPSWLFWATGSGPNARANDGEDTNVLLCLHSPFLCENLDLYLEGKAPLGYQNAWDFLKLSPLEIKGQGQGACPAPDKKEAAASVSEYKIGAKLCFSVDVLRKTPRDVIRAQVASILAHEMAHLQGHGEEIAEGVQNAVYTTFSVAALEEIQRVRAMIMSQFFFARSDLEPVAKGVLGDNADLKVVGMLGAFQGRMFTIMTTLPVGRTKEPSLAVKPEGWKRAHAALDVPFQRMFALQQSMINGKITTEQQMEQATIALKELEEAETQLSEFLGSKALR